MKRGTVAWIIVFLIQIIFFTVSLVLFHPRAYYPFDFGYKELAYSGESEKIKYVVNETIRNLNELQSLQVVDFIATPQDMIDSEYIDYYLELVENRKNQIVIRIYGRSRTDQEVSSTSLIFDMTSDMPIVTKETETRGNDSYGLK